MVAFVTLPKLGCVSHTQKNLEKGATREED
jgi:hypothetical protein